jgi:hypothetical protein
MNPLKALSTVICCPHRYISLFTSLMFSTSRISLCSLQWSLSHSTARKSSKLCLKFWSCCHCPWYAPVSQKWITKLWNQIQWISHVQVMWSSVGYQLWYNLTIKKWVRVIEPFKHTKWEICVQKSTYATLLEQENFLHVNFMCGTVLHYRYGSFVGWDSKVGIATHYGLDSPGTESQWGWDILYPSRPALEPTKPLIHWVRALSWG